MPKISAIMPVYNAEKTVIEAVESVLNQTYSDLELIIIDDGSTDRSLDIITAIDDPRISVHSFPHSGLSPTRNRAIRMASGSHIAFIDADDRWFPGKIDAQIKALEENQQACVAYCWEDYVDEEGRFLCKNKRITYSGNVYAKMLTHNFIGSGSNILVRRDALETAGLFDEALPAVEDWELYIRLSARCEFICVPLVLLHYRLSRKSLSSSISVMEGSFKQVVVKAFAEAPVSLKHLKHLCEGRFYEYLSVKATQFFPDPSSARAALRLYAMAVCHHPPIVFQILRRPWVLKSNVKALLGLLPFPFIRTVFSAHPGTWRS